MSLTLKLLLATLLLGSFCYANTPSEKVEEFLSDKFDENPGLQDVSVSVDEVAQLKQLKGWNAYIVSVKASLKNKPESKIKQKMIWFSNGDVITQELVDMQSGQSFAEMVKPNFKEKYYAKENLIYGNENARHKVAIFSDPLCPFCKASVPSAIEEMKKEPEKFAIYYYHFPLERIHPASVALVKAAVAAELKGVENVVLKLYNVQVNPNEKDLNKILAAFNKAVDANVTTQDLQSEKVLKQIQFDEDVANDVMVAGTPTLYLDGKIDKTKNKYKKAQ